MMTIISVDYIIDGMMEPKTKIIRTEEIKEYLAEYVPVVHKVLADELGVDTKDVSIVDWKYISRD